MNKALCGLLLSWTMTSAVCAYAQAPVAVSGSAPGAVTTGGVAGAGGVGGGSGSSGSSASGGSGSVSSSSNGNGSGKSNAPVGAVINNSGPVQDQQPPTRSVQTTYDTSPQAGGTSSDDDKSQQKPMFVNSSGAISPNMPQVGGPSQLNFHQRHAHAEVTQTKVIFAGGQAVKVDEPVVMEYTWSKPRMETGFARVIPRNQPGRKNR